MPFVSELTRHRSVAIVGMTKNAGKTECLNYVLRRLHGAPQRVAVTSIGVDGESVDAVTGTRKPEITLREGMTFVTSETHYRKRRISAEVLRVSTRGTSLGRLVTARAMTPGNVILSGPADTASLSHLIAEMPALGADLTLVDGALSRLSIASPAVTDALVLSTGAALARSIPEISALTRYVCDLIDLPLSESVNAAQLESGQGLRALNDSGEIVETGVKSAFITDEMATRLLPFTTLMTAGAVSERLLTLLSRRPDVADIRLIVDDFTRIFAKPETFYAFRRRGGRVEVARKCKLLAVCVNPVSPDGYRLDSEALCDRLRDTLHRPVYDIRRIDN